MSRKKNKKHKRQFVLQLTIDMSSYARMEANRSVKTKRVCDFITVLAAFMKCWHEMLLIATESNVSFTCALYLTLHIPKSEICSQF